MTRVEECTKADTGVGAAIAAGSHAENGNWALFVHAERVIIIRRVNGIIFELLVLYKYVQWPHDRISAIDTNNPTSPSRLVKAVTIPALYDLELW